MIKYKSAESKQAVLDAQDRGRITQKNRAKKRREKYYSNPKRCLYCNISLPYNGRLKRKFCSYSCAAKKHNFGRKKNKKKKTFCVFCNKELSRADKKYCNLECVSLHKRKRRIEKLEKGLLNDEQARRAYRTIAEKQCTICKLTEWNNKEIPLVVDHIDGDHANNFISNLRMVCPNCDAQLGTYKSKNVGKGRKYRKKYYNAPIV